jgi:hypothetical protein
VSSGKREIGDVVEQVSGVKLLRERGRGGEPLVDDSKVYLTAGEQAERLRGFALARPAC